MTIKELQAIRDGLCDKAEQFMAPGVPFDPAAVASNGQGYGCHVCGRPHLHITPALLRFWTYQDANLAYWQLQKELRAREIQLSAAIAEAEARIGGFEAQLAEVTPTFAWAR